MVTARLKGSLGRPLQGAEIGEGRAARNRVVSMDACGLKVLSDG